VLLIIAKVDCEAPRRYVGEGEVDDGEAPHR
jgi:hypothetical protein